MRTGEAPADRAARQGVTLKLRWLLLFAGLVLGACTRAPPPVRYFADGKPARLSDWGVVFRSGDALELNEHVVPYDLNTPLFSDYAHKLRTIWMPERAAAKYDAQQTFDFPVGTIISKTFYYPLPKAGGTMKSSRVLTTRRATSPAKALTCATCT